jgi:hypothetical protein
MKTFLSALLLILMLCISCQNNTPYTEEMKAELQAMYNKDQKAQEYDMAKVQRKSYSDSMEIAFNALIIKNTVAIKKYFREYGFPGIKENGEKATLNFWLLVQHSDHDVNFQNQVLIAMKKELDAKNVKPSEYAYLYDRVKKNQGKPQLYGTQMVWDSHGIHTPYNLESPEKVNERRKEMGLNSIEEYLQEFEN